MKISARGLAELKRSEANRAYAYPDVASDLYKRYPRERWGFKPAREILAKLPASASQLDAKPWTVGYGQTVGVDMDTYFTPEVAEANLIETVGKYEVAALRNLTVRPTQGQFDALVQIAWNVMAAVAAKSSIVKAHNRRDWAAASRAFNLYNKANGQVNEGLVLRRQREAAAYLAASPSDVAYNVGEETTETTLPARVDKERSMAKSEINIASTVAGGSTAVAAISESVSSVAAIKDGVATLADWAIPILLIAVVCLCVYIVLQRNKQREQGWS